MRLISNQKDSDAKGWWAGDCFNIRSFLDEKGLLAFFLTQYSPTPILAPWNGGSGFYDKDLKTGIDFIKASHDQRLAGYRKAINAISSWPEMAAARKCRSTKNKLDEKLT